MNALVYILLKSLKNSLKELRKTPGKLVMYLFVLIVIVGGIIISFIPETHIQTLYPMFAFTGILFVFIGIFAVVNIHTGLSNGSAIFDMNDVNLLFVSPIHSRKILLYGIVRMTKTAFLASFFILFQSSTLANFGIDFSGVLLTLVGVVVSMVIFSIMSLLIYSGTNSRPKRKRAVKWVSLLLFLPLVAFAVYQFVQTQDVWETLETVIKSPVMTCIPVVGWMAAGITALLNGSVITGMIYFCANLLLGAGMIVYLLLSNPDYYEDVLVATETAYERQRAIAEGNIAAAGTTDKRVRVGTTGIPLSGAAAIFGKHLRESFRENRFGFLTLSSVLISLGGIVLAVFFGDISILIFTLPWAQIFLIGTGRGLKDLYSHYIYMIPESSLRKIIWSNMELVSRTLIENGMMFGIAGLILHSSFFKIVSCVLAYTLFSYLLIAVNYAIMRFTGADASSGLLVLIYYFVVMVVILPGVILAIAVGTIIGGENAFALGLLAVSVWELLAGTIGFVLSKGVLHNCDMLIMRTKK